MNKLITYVSIVILQSNALITYAVDGCAIAPKSHFVVSVKDKGALGDGLANDTPAFQAAVNQVSGTGGTVLVPEGNYMIDAVTGVDIGSDMNFALAKGAVLRAIPNDKENYSVLRIRKSSNVVVSGGEIIGERLFHKGKKGEWGMGISILESRNIVVSGVVVRDNWGDGFYVSGLSRGVKLCSVVADNNRRQGLSVISVDGLIVQDSSFINTGGAAPQAGIDIEPNAGDTVNNVKIFNSRFSGNKGWGIKLTLGARPDVTDFIKNVSIENNYISENSLGGIGVLNAIDSNLSNNTFVNNNNYGVVLYKATVGNRVNGNRVIGSQTVLDNGKNVVDLD